jgi:hypothetical protein
MNGGWPRNAQAMAARRRGQSGVLQSLVFFGCFGARGVGLVGRREVGLFGSRGVALGTGRGLSMVGWR